MNKYILDVKYGQKNTAGAKAKEDITQILLKNNYKNLSFSVRTNKIAKLLMTGHDWKKSLAKINNNDVVVLQYPMYSRYAINTFFKIVNKMNLKINKIVIIHDIEALRLYKNNKSLVNEELQLLNKFDSIIVHNKKMEKWLLQNGITSNMVSLEIFDYINDNPIVEGTNEDPIIFAGNLKKSQFLEKFLVDKKVELFGVFPSSQYPNNIHYNGIKSPEELPKYLNGSFGLVWDGDSLETNSGIYGEYTRYNNPHKVSLYLSSGLPVIVWKEAAIASFIKEHKLGIVIDNLATIDSCLSSISNEEYNEMKLNVKNISSKIKSGFYIIDALTRISQLK